MPTVAELAEKVYEERRRAWDKSGAWTGIAAAASLGPEDDRAVRRTVSAAGYSGPELDTMAREVASRVVAKVQAMKDSVPVDGGD